MTSELRPHFLSGQQLYAVLTRAQDAKALKGSTWETPLTANWASYAIALAEQSTTGYYYGDIPGPLAAGLYQADYYMRVGVTPLPTDPLIGGQSLDWDGIADSGVGAGVNVSKIAGDSAAAVNQAAAARAVYAGTVTGASPTSTALADTGLAQTAVDFWRQRLIIFTSGTQKYQVAFITGFNPATNTLTFSALTQAPAQGDTYVIL